MAIFSSNYSIELYLPKDLGPFFAILFDKCFPKEKFTAQGRVTKNPVFEQHSAFSYLGLLLDPAEDFGPDFFCPSVRAKKIFYSVCAYHKLFLVFSSNLRNLRNVQLLCKESTKSKNVKKQKNKKNQEEQIRKKSENQFKKK